MHPLPSLPLPYGPCLPAGHPHGPAEEHGVQHPVQVRVRQHPGGGVIGLRKLESDTSDGKGSGEEHIGSQVSHISLLEKYKDLLAEDIFKFNIDCIENQQEFQCALCDDPLE